MKSRPHDSPTMQDVADAAGVSRATVSRALQGNPRIPKRTRDRIRIVAEKLGYRSNALVAALMSHRRAVNRPAFRAVIAYVTRYEKAGAWRAVSESFERIFTGAKENAARQGYKLEEFCLNDPPLSTARFSRMLRARGIHGLLIAPLPRPSGHLRLAWEHFATVAIGYSLARPEMHRVATDHFGCLVTAARECRKRGYRRLGVLLTGWVNERTDRRWLGAQAVEAARVAEEDRIPPLITHDYDEEAFLRWFRVHRPDAIMGVHMYRVLPALKKLGLEVPRDLGVITLEQRPREAGLSGMDQNHERIGAAAVNTLIGMLHRGERDLPVVPEKVLVDATWVEGTTLPRRKPKPLPSKKRVRATR